MRYFIYKKGLLRNLLLLLFIGFFSISGCNNSSTTEENVVTSLPTLIMAPNASTPLAGLLELQTSGLSRVLLTVSDGSDEWSKDFEEFNSNHSLTVLGFKPDRAHTVTVRVLDIDGIDLIEPSVFDVVTDPLPQGFPEISVTSIPELMEPGVTLFEAAGYLIAVNEIGEVV